MFIGKFTILLTMVCALLIFKIREWAKSHTLEVFFENYPFWFYISVLLIYIYIIGIFASMIWLLFCYW